MENISTEVFVASLISIAALVLAYRRVNGKLRGMDVLLAILIGMYAGPGFIKMYQGVWPSNFTFSLHWYLAELHEHVCAFLVVLFVAGSAITTTSHTNKQTVETSLSLDRRHVFYLLKSALALFLMFLAIGAFGSLARDVSGGEVNANNITSITLIMIAAGVWAWWSFWPTWPRD